MDNHLQRTVSDLTELLKGISAPFNSFHLTVNLLVWGHLSEFKKIPATCRLNEKADFEKTYRAFRKEFNIKTRYEPGPTPSFNITSELLSKIEPRMLKMAAAGVFKKLELDDIAKYNTDSRGELTWPVELAELMVAIINPDKSDEIYCPWEETGQIAARLVKHPVKRVYIETTQESAISNQVCLTLDPKPEIHISDPILSPSAIKDGELVKFDSGIASPPFGKKYKKGDIKDDFFGRFDHFHAKSTSIDVFAILHMLSQTRKTVALVMPLKVLFSSGGEARLRQELLEKRQIKAVIELPGKLFQGTAVQTCVLILEPLGVNDEVLFVDATGDTFVERDDRSQNKLINVSNLAKIALGKMTSDYAVSVPVHTIVQNDRSLVVSRYVLSEKEKKARKLLEQGECFSLGYGCSLIAGPLMRKPENEESAQSIKTLDMSCFSKRGYIQHRGKYVKVDQQWAGDGLLKPHDILIVSKGSLGTVGIVPPDIPTTVEGGGWRAPSFATTVRCDRTPDIDPIALFMQLRSPLGQLLIEQLSVGASVSILRVSDLKRMLLKSLTYEEARRVIEVFNEELKTEEEIKRLREKQKENASQVALFNID